MYLHEAKNRIVVLRAKRASLMACSEACLHGWLLGLRLLPLCGNLGVARVPQCARRSGERASFGLTKLQVGAVRH